jgi:hypothetical protein
MPLRCLVCTLEKFDEMEGCDGDRWAFVKQILFRLLPPEKDVLSFLLEKLEFPVLDSRTF